MKKLKLTKGKEAIIDDIDFERVSQRKWSFHHTGYVVGGYPQVRLHRFILNAKKGEYVDHINMDKLDNRRENLRLCTPAQNQYNQLPKRKIPKCIYWREARKAWIVRITADGKRHWVGYFKNFDEAKKEYEKAVIRLHGEFARI
jgi:hypothetical protein